SSLNAIRHGLTAQAVVMPSENIAAYQRLIASYFDDLKPNGAIERQFVQTLADTAWRMNRIRVIENNLFAFGSMEDSRAAHADPEIRASLAMTSALSTHCRELATISLHEQRLSRLYERTLNQLRELQAARRDQEVTAMANAANLRKFHEMNNLPYDPAEDGFVFSIQEIDSHIRRAGRQKEANRAAFDNFAAQSA
ncbi:MAG: hypothetical protein ACRD4P_16250, partial [Bryobacteraceae bacterium]